MKPISKLILFATTILLFNCNEVDELTNVEIDREFETSVNINSNDVKTPISGTTTLSNSTTVDISTDPRVKQGLDLIDSVDINAINLSIENYVGDTETTLSDIEIVIGGNKITLPNTTINLSEAANNETVFAIGDKDTLTRIASALKENPEIDIDFTGTLTSSGEPVSFTPNFVIDTTIVIDVI